MGWTEAPGQSFTPDLCVWFEINMWPLPAREEKKLLRSHTRRRLVWCTLLRSGVDYTPAELLPDCPKWFPP